jgi:Tfp pilus assembly protein PilV
MLKFREQKLKKFKKPYQELKKRIVNSFREGKSGGVTLIETITALFLLTTGILAISSLISYFIPVSSIASQKLIATYLAQEGVEIVRNLRDNNLIQGKNWDDGLANGNYEADYQSQSLTNYADRFLKIGDFYNYTSGELTNFKRKINLEKTGDVLKIVVEVSWQERGRSHSVVVQENLYNLR